MQLAVSSSIYCCPCVKKQCFWLFFFNLTVPLFHLIPEGSATAVTMLSGIDTFSSQALGDAASVLLPSHCVRRRQAAITPCVESSLLPPQSSFWFW